MNRKILFRWAKVVVLVYCLIGIAVYYGQDRLLIHPAPLPGDHVFAFEGKFTELNLPYDQGINLNLVEFKARPADSAARGIVLYFHDGQGNISDHAADVSGFTGKGYELWMMDYPGFGKSTGTFSEKACYDYALECYQLARSRWRPSQIVICGKGIGTGVAAQLASVRNCRRLVLVDPFYSVTSEFRRWLFLYPLGMMLHYHFPTDRFLPDVTDPITIFGGDRRLKRFLKPGDTRFDRPGDPASALNG
ncbi:MAG TPA: alpha/beta fold hydrolase [Puia sp.]|nr:alpha/beta fold hydrolase [Puia sp.]